jgi:hypothetical protein
MLNALGFRLSLVQSAHSRFVCASGTSPIPALHFSGYRVYQELKTLDAIANRNTLPFRPVSLRT